MNSRRGLFWATITYILWGITPLYWKLLTDFPAEDLIAHRVIWSAICLLPLYISANKRTELVQVIRAGRKGILLLVGSALLIGYNWYIYVAAVTTDRVLDTSLGYFMTPLMSVMVGVLLLRERLSRLQLVAVALAVLGVVLFAAQLGSLPSVALLLSSTFAFYGYLKKTVRADGALSVSVETILLAPLALGFLFHRGWGHHSYQTWLLLVASGPLTAIPLVWYAWAVQEVPFSIVGFLQYISPVLQFLLAVYLYREPFGSAQKGIFVLIWIALGLFSWNILRRLTGSGGEGSASEIVSETKTASKSH